MMKSLLAKRKPLRGFPGTMACSKSVERQAPFSMHCHSFIEPVENQMNIKMTSVALALIATSAAAFAAEEFVEHTNIVSTKTRAEVRAELDKSRLEGRQPVEFVEQTRVAGGKTRAEVRAELEQAYAQGQMIGHAPEFVEHTHVASTRSRDEVRQEAVQAAQAGRAPKSGS
jgi:hypothetical protein